MHWSFTSSGNGSRLQDDEPAGSQYDPAPRSQRGTARRQTLFSRQPVAAADEASLESAAQLQPRQRRQTVFVPQPPSQTADVDAADALPQPRHRRQTVFSRQAVSQTPAEPQAEASGALPQPRHRRQTVFARQPDPARPAASDQSARTPRRQACLLSGAYVALNSSIDVTIVRAAHDTMLGKENLYATARLGICMSVLQLRADSATHCAASQLSTCPAAPDARLAWQAYAGGAGDAA